MPRRLKPAKVVIPSLSKRGRRRKRQYCPAHLLEREN